MPHHLKLNSDIFGVMAQFLDSLNNDLSEVYSMHSQYKKESNVPLIDWIKRIYELSTCSTSTLLIGGYYLMKISCLHSQLIFSRVNIRRLFFVSVMLSAKMNEDNIFKNIDWVFIGDNTYAINVVNRMETEFLNLLNFELYVNEAEYDAFCDFLALNFQRRQSSPVTTPTLLSCPNPTDTNKNASSNRLCNSDVSMIPSSINMKSPYNNSYTSVSTNSSPLNVTNQNPSPTAVSGSVCNSNVISPHSPTMMNVVHCGSVNNNSFYFPPNYQQAPPQFNHHVSEPICSVSQSSSGKTTTWNKNGFTGEGGKSSSAGDLSKSKFAHPLYF